jgi:hypothetical protein
LNLIYGYDYFLLIYFANSKNIENIRFMACASNGSIVGISSPWAQEVPATTAPKSNYNYHDALHHFLFKDRTRSQNNEIVASDIITYTSQQS